MPDRPDNSLTVTFLDVGAGDCAVIQLPNKEVMLIDGGGLMDDSFDMGKAVIAPYLYSRGIKKVDYIVLTHPHRDHVGGLPLHSPQIRYRTNYGIMVIILSWSPIRLSWKSIDKQNRCHCLHESYGQAHNRQCDF